MHIETEDKNKHGRILLPLMYTSCTVVMLPLEMEWSPYIMKLECFLFFWYCMFRVCFKSGCEMLRSVNLEFILINVHCKFFTYDWLVSI